MIHIVHILFLLNDMSLQHGLTPYSSNVWRMVKGPWRHIFDARGIPSASFFNVRGSPIDFYRTQQRWNLTSWVDHHTATRCLPCGSRKQ